MTASEKESREALLLKAIHEVASGGSLKVTLSRLVSEALAGVGGELGWVAVVEPEGLCVEAVQGVSAPAVGDVIPFGKGLTGLVHANGEPYYAPDVSAEEQYWKVAEEVKSEYLVPLVAGGEVVGVLNVESTSVDGFSQEERDFIAALARLAADAVRLAKRYEDVSGDLANTARSLEERVQALSAMSDAAQAISSSLDLDDVIRVIIERARDVIQADAAHLVLKNAGGDFVLHTSTSLSRGTPVDIESGITGWVIRNRKALLVPDVSQDDRYVTWRPATSSELAVPLMDAEGIIGALNFESSRLSAFDTFHLELADTFAGHVVVAVRNAALYTHLENARRDLALTEGLRAAGEVAGDIIHYVANKVGALPQTVKLISEKVRGQLQKDDERLVLKLLELVGKSANEVLSMKGEVLDTRKPLAQEAVEIGPFMNELVERFFSEGVKVVVAGGDEVSVLADRHALVRLFDNALMNAVRALKEMPEPQVTIGWKRDGDDVEIEVRDNGPGFPDDIVESGVIPRFGTGDQDGTGLGLWLSERLAARMGGKLSLGNAAGGGAYVRVRLPAAP